MLLDIIDRQQKFKKVEQASNFDKLVFVKIFEFFPCFDFH